MAEADVGAEAGVLIRAGVGVEIGTRGRGVQIGSRVDVGHGSGAEAATVAQEFMVFSSSLLVHLTYLASAVQMHPYTMIVYY